MEIILTLTVDLLTALLFFATLSLAKRLLDFETAVFVGLATILAAI
jgi:hypothetical protein